MAAAPSAPSFAADLPRPTLGKLFLHVLGPGFGESQVVVLPDGRAMAIDGTVVGKRNLVAELLDHLGISSLEAVVLTHPDLDHVRGVADVVKKYQPKRVFRYPGLGYVRDLVAAWCEAQPTSKRFVDLREAIEAIEESSATTHDVCATTRSWRPQGADYTVHFIAPTERDRERVRLVHRHIVEHRDGVWKLKQRFNKLMSGHDTLGDAPNALSIGLVIEWGERKVLLAGDIENGKRNEPLSGWKGVIATLDDPDVQPSNSHLITDVDAVKVAHHGSNGAFFEDAWKRHAQSRKTTAVVAPFERHGLPMRRTVGQLRQYCDQFAITAPGANAFGLATQAGWKQAAVVSATSMPCVTAIVSQDPGATIVVGNRSGLFVAT